MSYSITACLNIWEGRPHSFLLQLVDGIGGIGEYKLGFVFPKKFMFQVSWFLVYELALNLKDAVAATHVWEIKYRIK
jgi:hypothetical protein